MRSVKILSKCLILHFKQDIVKNVDLKGSRRSQDMLVIDMCSGTGPFTAAYTHAKTCCARNKC